MLNLVNNLPKYMDNIWSTYFMYDNYSIKDTALLRQNLNKYDYVFVNLFVSSMHTMNGRDNETIKWLEGISKKHYLILNVIGQPFILAKFNDVEDFWLLLLLMI